jgi:RNase P subunit RPR2
MCLTNVNRDQLEIGRTFPVVICAGCQKPMTPTVTESGRFHTTTYHCEQCGAGHKP